MSWPPWAPSRTHQELSSLSQLIYFGVQLFSVLLAMKYGNRLEAVLLLRLGR